ncbi:MAG TPA: hypothetical protein VGG25_31225 [Streptosporangiaceae bacterium]|jgi:hypothetical protein
MTEAQLLARVTGLCEELGLLWHHCNDARRCTGPDGFPDLVIAGQRGVMFAELKSASGETSAGQDLWLWTLDRAATGGHFGRGVFRPNLWDSGQIRRCLEALR